MSINTENSRKAYQFREIDTSDKGLSEVLDLFISGGSGMKHDISYLNWQYNQNPNGLPVGFNAYFENKLVSHYVAIPIKANLFGCRKNGLLSINTRTDVEHQGQGLFTRLAEMTYAKAKSLGFEFVVGVANQNSVHGFTKKLGFQLVGQLETRMCITLPKKTVKNIEFETLWDKSSIEWRLGNPLKNYDCRNFGKFDYLFGHSNRFRALLDILDTGIVADTVPKSYSSIIPFGMWIGVDPSINWSRTINIVVPQKLKKVSLNLIFRDLVDERVLNPEKVKFTALDFDSY